MFVDSDPGARVVGEAADGQEAIRYLESNEVDLILLDMHMPGQSGTLVASEVKTRWPDVKILVLTSFSSWDRIYPALKAGASGYILKDAPPPELLAAIKAVAAGGRYLGEAVASDLLEGIGSRTASSSDSESIPASTDIGSIASPPDKTGARRKSGVYKGLATSDSSLSHEGSKTDSLTPRELDVLRLIAQGLDNKEIASRLCLSEKTVKTHVANIFQKLDVKSRTQAALLALEKGLV